MAYTQHPGIRVYHNIISVDKCTEIMNRFSTELLYFVFGDDAPRLAQQFPDRITELIVNAELRKDVGIDAEIIRRGGNPRESRLLRKSGKAMLATSPVIRDLVLRDRNLYNLMNDFYKTDKLAYVNGLNYPIYKPKAAEKSIPVIDCKIFEPFEPADGSKNPFHYFSMVCISKQPGHQHGGFKVLQNFDTHFETIISLIGPKSRFPIKAIKANKKQQSVEFDVLENLKVEEINQELYNRHILLGYAKETFKPLEWVFIETNPGDVVIMDCRIPYVTEENKSMLPSMFIPFALRPVDKKWYRSLKHQQLLTALKDGKHGDWVHRTFKGSNIEEYNWRSHSIRTPDFNLHTATNISNFDNREKLIFGLGSYYN